MIEAKEHIAKIKTYKPGKPIEEVIRELGLEGEIIKLASNENPLGTSPLAIKAMRQALAESFLYPDDNCFYLKNTLAKKFNVTPEEIIVGNGSVEILPYITLAYLGQKDSAVVSQGAFIWFKIAVDIAGGELIEVPMKNYTHDLKAVAAAIKENTKLVFIANPNNPTGTIVKKDEVEEFFKSIPDHVLVIMDEAYCEYITDLQYPDSFKIYKERDNILILRTFSKIYGLAGARLGYAIANKNIISNLMKLRISFNVNRISQIGGKTALNDYDFIKKSYESNEKGKQYLYDEYNKLGIFFLPTYGNFIFVDFDRDSQLVFEALQQKGIIARTIKEYGFPNALRITIGTEKQNHRLIRTLKEVMQH
ncbi:histidinol-phosphate transaminase [candidate division WOR-3 bacterium RBG_13_43_14]|uniref:Histidinol-phosphate aminotransferase n=1 Tax=candidate division WOR-3 bacterium RBG_13_43_14 TaxID=1802590 RepID=A0A1F4U4I1_UNCW3|nr:MAG: histidinol-phosphate transaminase [candidate division WOR-3 bacterium RBG_13_43_14]